MKKNDRISRAKKRSHVLRHRRNRATVGCLIVDVREEYTPSRNKRALPYRLVVTYYGFNRDTDRQLFKLVGKWSDGSGMTMVGPDAGVRDHDWLFATRAPALKALARVRTLKTVKSVLTGPIEP
jgi:hypothetical protein